MLLRRYVRKYREQAPELSEQLVELLRATPTYASALRGEAKTMPVDVDSRLELLRVSPSPVAPHRPILSEAVRDAIDQIVKERLNPERLRAEDLDPSRSALLVGPPGVGKTLSAIWIAERLRLPLLVLDLAAVMNSFLGRTGTNLRHVLDHARQRKCVLLLDELDAVAKRRDDQAEIGELKRLVTVLLQEVDHWPTHALLLGATNHPDLLDPAIWRRFDVELHLGLPDRSDRRVFVDQLSDGRVNRHIGNAFALATAGWSFADLERTVQGARRRAALNEGGLDAELLGQFRALCRAKTLGDRRKVSAALLDGGLSQRRVSGLTGMSRDTLRKLARSGEIQ